MLSCTQSYPWWDFPSGVAIFLVITILSMWRWGLKGFFILAGISGIGFILILIYLSRHGC